MQEATTIFNDQVRELHQAKAKMAEGLAIVVREIAETGHNPENTLEDIFKLARMLDISAPAERNTAATHIDPRYYLLDYLKRNSGSATIRGIDADDILFDKSRPFTCISQVDEILEDVSDKLNRNYIKKVEYAA